MWQQFEELVQRSVECFKCYSRANDMTEFVPVLCADVDGLCTWIAYDLISYSMNNTGIYLCFECWLTRKALIVPNTYDHS